MNLLGLATGLSGSLDLQSIIGSIASGDGVLMVIVRFIKDALAKK